MMHILIQILRWLIQPKVWRFVGFASAVVGLLCYALSSSFNYLFGDWNLFKIFLYTFFSFIICFVILFAKRFQHSRSLRFKAHTAFLVLTITSVYSFFFDKVMNGKPDAYSLISCAAFSIMSLSLSRQTKCGFEIDLLYFFLGCLIVQLMKIKLQLFFLGVGFSYSIIILRSFFTSIDATGDNQYSQLQDGNSVVLYINSLQPDYTDIASVRASNSNIIDSPQLVINNDISSAMEQLRSFVKALQHENLNILQMILTKYDAEEHSDPNFTVDALKPETIKGLKEIAKVMVIAGFEKEFFDVYNCCRRECLDKCLMHRFFALQKLSIEEVHNISWKDLKDEIQNWIRATKVALKILFPGERQLCDRVFFGFSAAADFSFMEICKGSTLRLLNFANYVATRSHPPEHLFKILEMFETLRDLIPEFESLFCDQYSVCIRNKAMSVWKRLREAIKGIFTGLEYIIGQNPANMTVNGGGLHPISQYVLNYLGEVSRSRQTLEQVFDNSSLSSTIHRIMDILESNLEAKSKSYKDPSLGYIFLMNNNTYIVQVTKDNELGTILGDDWLQKHAMKVWHYCGGEAQQLLLNTQQIGDIDAQIEGSPFTPEERYISDEYEEMVVAWSSFRRYYRCIHMKLPFCRAKKKVQQLGDNPNVFEVTYNGGHSCRMALTIPSLILPARRILRDVIQTNISSSSTTYSEWLSSGTAAKYIDSIPKAKLASPVDGGHHPMMDNVVEYLVSAIRSHHKVVNGDEAFSQHTEGTMELLESILASKSEEYVDSCLRHFFMMNNWRYLV